MTVRAYGHWDSPLSPEAVVTAQVNLAFPIPGDLGVFFLQTIPEENNHFALFLLDEEGRRSRVSPNGFNLRSRVHEYGGLPCAVTAETVFWCHFDDQRVYRQRRLPGGAGWSRPEPLSAADSGMRYADFCVDVLRGRLLCVREDHSRQDGVRNCLVSLDCEADGEALGEILFEGSDFVAAPVLSPDSRTLALISWCHPAMPWDETRLQLLTLDERGEATDCRTFTGDDPASLLQPQFSSAGDLYFLADWSDWWNLYRLPANSDELSTEEVETVLPMQRECCSAPWQLGHRSYALRGEEILLSSNVEGLWQLQRVPLDGGVPQTLMEGQGAIEQLRCKGDLVTFLAASPRQGASLYALDPKAQPACLFEPGAESRPPAAAISSPRPVSFPVGDGELAHGLFYPPVNPEFEAPEDHLPPLIVVVHGGPTSTARAFYNPALQFWTSRGFAVLDLNHRGSTGYGRRFRQRLYGQWGVVDIEDIVAGVHHLIDTGLVHPEAVLIRGGSAGGYAVLAALCASELFAAGACYYGVSDLETLASDTHKFESRYLDQLIGPYPEARDLYRARSPIHRVDDIDVPVLFLQGGEDRVVPPGQTETIARRLADKHPASRFILFPGEGHGFRAPANQIVALEAELDFYRQNAL